jgi:hypothetical protein
MLQNAKPILTTRKFLGIDNTVEDPSRIPPGEESFLTEGLNIDIDDTKMPHRRGGYGEPVYRASRIHSLFSYSGVVLFVQGTDLKKLMADYSASVVRSAVGEARMSYVGVQERIYYTNSSVIAYVKDGVSYEFPEPNQTFKSRMKAGQLIEWFNGRLYVARGGVLWYSGPMYPGVTDERRNFKNLGGYITMLRAVLDGLYVSNEKKTFFLPGSDPGEMSLQEVSDEPAIFGTDVKVDGSAVGRNVQPGPVVLWLSESGISVGLPGGKVFSPNGHYAPPVLYPGAATAALNRFGFYQYIVSQKTFPNIVIDSGDGFSLSGSMEAGLS